MLSALTQSPSTIWRPASLPLSEIDLLIVENVGNLGCPAEFRIGEDARAMVCSATEGEEKPLKYPLMFRAASSS